MKLAGRMTVALGVTLLGAAACVLVPSQVEANHPVLLEGNNAANGAPGTTIVPPGTSGDYDGDGLVGTAEDTDNATDRIFGTLTAALLGVNGGANANGKVLIVKSGRFGEQVRIPNVAAGQAAINGVTIIEAAPGVEADIDAVVSGDPGNAARQAAPGIIIDTLATDRMVILRNLQIRNFTIGLQVFGKARVTVEKCRFDSNVAGNIWVHNNARLTLVDSSLSAGGMRFNPGMALPAPGFGILFTDSAGGSIARTTVSHNVAGGVVNGGNGVVRVHDDNVVSDNAPNFSGFLRDEEGKPKIFN